MITQTNLIQDGALDRQPDEPPGRQQPLFGVFSSNPLNPLHPHLPLHTEVEARYFCRFSDLTELDSEIPLYSVGIHQSYFPVWALKFTRLVMQSLEGGESDLLSQLSRYSKSRLRHQEDFVLGDQYSLELKGSKTEETPEKIIPISREDYKELREVAPDYIFKNRKSLHGEIYLANQSRQEFSVPIVVDIDNIICAGRNVPDLKKTRPTSGLSVPIVEVEITRETRLHFASLFPEVELKSSSIISAVRRGAHNLPFLDKLTSLHHHPLEDHLSMRKLARKGFSEAEGRLRKYFRHGVHI